jgi:predicted Zn-dependent protease with MMP-like domain
VKQKPPRGQPPANGSSHDAPAPSPADGGSEEDLLEAADADAELDEALAMLGELLAEAPDEAFETFGALPEEVRALPDFQLMLAHIELRRERLVEARAVLKRLLEEESDDADAHHLLGDVLEDLGESDAATKHFLETLRLDAEDAAERDEDERRELFDLVEAELKRTMHELPPRFSKLLADVPLVVESLPAEHHVVDGLDPRALGLFEGPIQAERDGLEQPVAPTRIVLFAENLAAEFPDDDELCAQVGVTVLHEIGHYFGLDEDDLARLGLD